MKQSKRNVANQAAKAARSKPALSKYAEKGGSYRYGEDDGSYRRSSHRRF